MKLNFIDRLPPHSPEAEAGVLGCCLLSPNDCIDETSAGLSGKDAFYDLRHKTVYEALLAMRNEMLPIDLITVQQNLKDNGFLDQIGGIPFLSNLQEVPSAANLSYYLGIVREKHLLRRMIQTCTGVVGKIYDYEGDVESLLDECERDVMALRGSRVSSEMKPIKALVNESLITIEKMFERQGQISGLSTGLDELDRETDGLHPCEYILIAAFPSVGKTSLAMQIAQHIALELGAPVGIFSAEMSATSLVIRALCSIGRVNLRGIRQGHMMEADFPKLMSAAGRLSASKIHIDDSSDMTIQALRARARRMVQQHGIKLLVVDYAQLISSPGAENRTMELDSVSKGIKNMAKELKVPVILLSQLTKDAKGNVYLKGARALGEDADGYWMLKRPDDWQDTEETQASLSEPIELWLNKQRNEARGVCINLNFLKPYTTFEVASKFSDDSRSPHND